MTYRYEVAHSNDALDRVELAQHALSPEDVTREYELLDTPFHIFFGQRPAVRAKYAWKPGDNAIIVSLDGPKTQTEADDLLAEFLVWWNKMHKGLAVVLNCRL